MKKLIAFAAAFVCACLLSFPAFGQSDKAGMVGTITDPKGAVVPNATVTVTNVDTGATFETKTDSDGRYTTLIVLKPGTYTVTGAAKGFKATTSDLVVLQIGDVREVNVALVLGETSQTVTVTAEATLLQTETSERGEVITGTQVTDLPLKDRNFTQLAELTPGVQRVYVGVLTDSTAFNQGDAQIGQGGVSGASNNQGSTEASRFSRSGGASISVNGLRPTNNNFTLDGVDNNEPQFGTIGVFPNPDAIQEFKVETSVAKAETGHGGATLNTTYQSGTNSLHGSVYYYGQNSALNATDWEINRLRTVDMLNNGKTTAQAESDFPKGVIRVNEFGFTVGGPIIKNKTFFFGDYLGQRNATPNAFVTSVPTEKSRVGDFSEFTAPIMDPLTCSTPGDLTSPGCTPFPGNIISNITSRPDYSAQAAALFALYPLPTVTGLTDPGNGGGNNNFFGERKNQEKINSFDVKLDHRISEKNSITGRYTRDNQERDRANFFPNVPTAGFGAGNEVGNTRQVVVSDTHVFKPTLLNEFKFGWTHVQIGILNCGVEGSCGISATACQDLGIPNCNKGTAASSGGILTGGFGVGQFEFSGDGGLFQVSSNNYYIADAVSVIYGKHTFKTGIEVRPRYLDTIDGGRAGGLKGQIQYCTGCGNAQSTGNVQADYLLSRPGNFSSDGEITGGDKPFQLRTTEWSFYVQDDWKTTSRLTLNLGVRYDVFPSFREASGRLSNFDPFTGILTIAKGGSDSTVNTAYGNFGPRFGFAYNLSQQHRIVVRGGYGIFYALDGYDFPPVVRNPPLTNSVGFGPSLATGLDFNLTNGPPVPPAAANPPVILPQTSLFTLQKNQKIGSIQEFNLTTQWEFAKDWLLDVGYVGTLAHHLLGTLDYGDQGGFGAGLGLALTPLGVPINSDIAYENRYNSAYHGLQVGAEKRLSHNYLFRVAYTFSHDIDNNAGVFNALGEGRGTNGGPVDPFNLAGERGNSSLDRRHSFTADLVWNLPIGTGQWIAKDANPVLNKFIGGWQFNLIWSGGSGIPFTVIGNSTWGGRVVDTCANARAGATNGQYLNPSCFAPLGNFAITANCPVSGTTIVGATAPAGFVRSLDGRVDCLGNIGSPIIFGNEGRNIFTGPGFFRTDLSLFKNTNIGERVKVQFGVEFFNTFNQVFNVVPNNNISNGGSCASLSQNAFGCFDNAFPPRNIQYRMKILF